MKDRPALPYSVCLTGGPGGGKTTAADLFFREIGDSVAVVPEAATFLFAAGLPHTNEPQVLRAVQRAIYNLQHNLEQVQRALHPDKVLICDRGCLDGAAYWPDGPDGFLAAMETNIEAELSRYEAVIFFESAAAGGMSIAGNNPVRNETSAAAMALDTRLRELWQRHPRFTLVPHNPSFFKKITFGLATMESIVDELVHRGAQAVGQPDRGDPSSQAP